jgi:hypothetical protein
MKNHKLVITLLLLLAFVLSACNGSAPAAEEPAEEVATEAPMAEEEPTEAPAAEAAPVASMEGIAGSYDLTGTNPDASEYSGTLDVAAVGDAYSWSWNGGEYTGVGLQTENVVSVAWGADECYVVSYSVGDDGVLSGRWTDMAASGIGTDVATPTDQMGEGLEGLYNILGTNPDGSEYGCSLQVTKTADGVYEWYWFSCGEYTGVGIQDGNVVSVAYGSDSCSAISYHVEDDGTLNGSWTYVGMTDLGTDVATPK